MGRRPSAPGGSNSEGWGVADRSPEPMIAAAGPSVHLDIHRFRSRFKPPAPPNSETRPVSRLDSRPRTGAPTKCSLCYGFIPYNASHNLIRPLPKFNLSNLSVALEGSGSERAGRRKKLLSQRREAGRMARREAAPEASFNLYGGCVIALAPMNRRLASVMGRKAAGASGRRPGKWPGWRGADSGSRPEFIG